MRKIVYNKVSKSQKDWVRKLQISKVPYLRKVRNVPYLRKVHKLKKIADMRYAELIRGQPTFVAAFKCTLSNSTCSFFLHRISFKKDISDFFSIFLRIKIFLCKCSL